MYVTPLTVVLYGTGWQCVHPSGLRILAGPYQGLRSPRQAP